MALETLKTADPDVTLIRSTNPIPDGFQEEQRIMLKSTGILSYYVREPFYNCQISSIGYFCAILALPLEAAIKVLKAVFIGDMYRGSVKAQLLLDIPRNYESNMEKLFLKEDIVFKQQYESTNGSQMTIYLVRTKGWLLRNNK